MHRVFTQPMAVPGAGTRCPVRKSAMNPSPTPVTEDEVLAAAAALVEAFGATRTDEYFAAFSADATFVFHTEDRRLDSRAEYEALWNSWLADGWSVTACRSSDIRVQLLGDEAAVFSHTVHTTAGAADARETAVERETIVFARRDGRLLAVHEHLSALSASAQPSAGADA
ncbi:Calcium/calmodulin dependent protein kinase II Association [Arthrobacter saudimassiliensis]|uniref:Calcium/calmodulin dependent protein kinase II Association n=1 Tax=Arthrobacter saudimassiliensis TaxID=1461584 RepID=A0A078MKT7_9MICC|nr:Calcium/calmodulin dependent protein kinase II Association [Arthrobacter saudimassiliensis]